MRYYEVFINSQSYKKNIPLTYQSNEVVQKGSLVEVKLQNQSVIGIVYRETKKPEFKTADIIRKITQRALPSQLLDLLIWLKDYYPSGIGSIAALFAPSNLLQQNKLINQDVKTNQKISLPELTEHQLMAIQNINKKKPSPILLHGDTGTGKTRIYQELAKNTLANNLSVILLTPEIGLTPQLVESFESSFYNNVVVLHSRLTVAQRRSVWLRILNNKNPLIVIGPRSSLFAPLKNVGLIIIDEAHDGAYKQEQAPYYQTSRVAAKLAHLHGGQLVMGTATPLIADYYMFESKHLPIIRLTEKPLHDNFNNEPIIKVVLIRDREQFSRSPWLSNQLIEDVEIALKQSAQSLIFLNRRGTARLILCAKCGWQALCPQCDLPLTYHGDTHLMRCHTCGYNKYSPSSCPECNSVEITFKSIGTKALAEEINRLFPSANIQRFDSDSLNDDRLERNYESIKQGGVDIMVGTQLLTKGLDLPKLSVVGVVAADSSLYFPDYTAEERTYQMLTQIIGRVGRGHRNGSVVIQTYKPDSPSIVAAVSNDYYRFYKLQLSERQPYRFPPFSYVLKLTCKRASAKSAQQAGEKLKIMLRAERLNIQMSGPAPAFIEKNRGKYIWQLILRSKKRTDLVKIINKLPASWHHDIDPINLL